MLSFSHQSLVLSIRREREAKHFLRLIFFSLLLKVAQDKFLLFKGRENNLCLLRLKGGNSPIEIVDTKCPNTYVEIVSLSLELSRGVDLVRHDPGDGL